MKRFLAFIVFLIIFNCLCCSAEITESDIAKMTQSELDDEFEKNNNSLEFKIIHPYILILEEVTCEKAGYDTVLGEIKKQKNKSDYINAKYLQMIINKFNAIAENREGFDKIIVNDKDYLLLNNKTKAFLAFYNYNCTVANKEPMERYEQQREVVNTLYLEFENNKNNMKKNRELYDRVKNIINQNATYQKYLTTQQKTNTIVIDNERYINESLQKLSLEIENYSYKYEETKYYNWVKKNNKKFIRGLLREAVYNARFTPEIGSLYIFNPKDYPLKVFQNVQGGVILTGDTSLSFGSIPNSIFIQTTKKFADDTFITEPIIAEYKGLYNYTTVLGSSHTIHKFYRLDEKEQEANFSIPGQPFYFYAPALMKKR